MGDFDGAHGAVMADQRSGRPRLVVGLTRMAQEIAGTVALFLRNAARPVAVRRANGA
ncbi:hypothetical protein DFH07DRAFT_966254 [Mycena maculata]|uniref:Uncharacterized protein n=1 Tax=Mycena maculata TaxID=230809 RepID=A0AAD7I9M0_9AGAR|nr:hypothetical protein DFH07DRAFT_966254 [Mycena maculata]